MSKYRQLGASLDRTYMNDLNLNFDDVEKDIKAVDTNAASAVSAANSALSTASDAKKESSEAKASIGILDQRLDNQSDTLNKVSTAIPSIENKAINSDFSDGTNFWGTSGTVSLLTAQNNTLTVKPNPANGSKRIYLGKLSLNIPANHEVYIGYILRANKPGSFNMGIGTGSLGSTIVASENKTATTEPTLTSHLFKTGANGASWFRINTTEYTADTDFFEFQYVLVIDLTATFGAGKEPTKVDMDEYISRNGWFNGIKKMPVPEVVEFKVKNIGGGGSLDEIVVVNGVGNGIIDDTTAIQSALNAGTGGLVLLPKGTFLVSKTLYIPDDTTFVGMGPGSKIKLAVNHSLDSIPWRTFDGGYIIKPILTNNRNSNQAKNISVKDIAIDGQGVNDNERMGGLIFADAYNCHAERVYVDYINWTDQLNINSRGFNIACVRSEKISFVKTVTDHAGYECIGTFDDSKDVLVKGNFIGTGKRCSAQIHRNNFNITFDSNFMKQDQEYFTDAHGCLVIHGSSTRPAKGLTIVNNFFEERTNYAVVSFVEYQRDVIFANNQINGEDIIGLRINGDNKDFTVIGNKIRVNRTGITATCQGSLLITDNDIKAATLSGEGVTLNGVEKVNLQGNSIDSGRNGVSITDVENGVMVNQNIITAGWNSFAADYSSDPKIMIGQNIA